MKLIFQYRTLLCLVVTVLFLLHHIERINIPLLNNVENTAYDLRLKLSVPGTIDSRIVILDIDEKSLAQEGRWPWSRDKLSYLVDMLFEYYQIKLLGFDIVFSEPDTSSGLGLLNKLSKNELADNEQFSSIVEKLTPQLNFDTVFANSLESRPVVMGYYFNNADNINPSSSLPKPAYNLKDLPSAGFIKSYGYGANLKTLQDKALYGGYFNNVSIDIDGSFRRLPLITEYDGHLYESLSLAMYRRLLEQPPLEFTFNSGYDLDSSTPRLEAINIESLSIPVTDQGVALVPYRGKQGSFKYISATDVLNGITPPEELMNKIIIMGATAAGIFDLRITPVQNVYPGVEVHANLVSAMLDQQFKSKPTYMLGVEFVELILLALLVIVLYPKLSSGSAAIVFGIIISTMFLLNIYAWRELHIDNFIATPMVLLFILFSIQIYFGYFLETKRKNKLGQIFGQYIPSALVEDMSKSEDEYSLKGESRELTVLFSDVRGFTSISENMEPEELCELMNEILTPVTKVIHHNNGTIDKYIGDAVMAFWGAPLHDDNHASNAVKASLEFTSILESINQYFVTKDWPHIDIGVGINTGNMNVGNMGSEFRIAYTVMGDAVNLGSRLEALTKQYGVRVIVSESTRLAAPEFTYLELDRVRVKGKNEPITIYEPLCLSQDLTKEKSQQIDLLQIAYDYYHNQQWKLAQKEFSTLAEQYPDKLLYRLYLDRIEEYIKTTPEADWDGVYTHTSK